MSAVQQFMRMCRGHRCFRMCWCRAGTAGLLHRRADTGLAKQRRVGWPHHRRSLRSRRRQEAGCSDRASRPVVWFALCARFVFVGVAAGGGRGGFYMTPDGGGVAGVRRVPFGQVQADGGVKRCCCCWRGAHAAFGVVVSGRGACWGSNTCVRRGGGRPDPPAKTCVELRTKHRIAESSFVWRIHPNMHPISQCSSLLCRRPGRNGAQVVGWKCASRRCDGVGWRGCPFCAPLGWVGAVPLDKSDSDEHLHCPGAPMAGTRRR